MLVVMLDMSHVCTLSTVNMADSSSTESSSTSGQCASMSGFCRQFGYNTSSGMALLLMRGLSIRKTATLLTVK